MQRLGVMLIVIGASACAHKNPAATVEDHPESSTCISANGSGDAPASALVDDGDSATVTVSGPGCRPTYSLATTAELRGREQTYPAWTANDTVQIGTSKALSTVHAR